MIWGNVAKSCEQSSINKLDKQSRISMHVYIKIYSQRQKRRDGMAAGFTDYSDLLNLTRAWEEPRAGCWLEIPQRCQSTVVFIPTIDTVEVLLDKMATLTAPRERATGMVLRCLSLNREAVYSGPADAEEARNCRKATDMAAGVS